MLPQGTLCTPSTSSAVYLSSPRSPGAHRGPLTSLCQPINPPLLPGSSTHFFSWHAHRMGFLLPSPWHCRGHRPCQHPVPDQFPVPGCSNVTTATALSGRGHRRQAGVEAAFPASSVCILAGSCSGSPRSCLQHHPQLCPHLSQTEGPSQAPSHKSLLKQVCGCLSQPSNGVSFVWEAAGCCCVTPSRTGKALSPRGGVSVSQVSCLLLGAGVPVLCYSVDRRPGLSGSPAGAGTLPKGRLGLLGAVWGCGTGPLTGEGALIGGRTASG